MQLISRILINWVMIYLVDSTVQSLNNRGPVAFKTTIMAQEMTVREIEKDGSFQAWQMNGKDNYMLIITPYKWIIMF